MNNKLKLYIDSAKIEDWKTWLPLNLFYGITTNPILLERANEKNTIQNLTRLANEAFSLNIKEFQIQLWGKESKQIYKIGSEISKIHPNIVMKIPLNTEGIIAAQKLIQENKNITFTGIYSSYQYLISSKVNSKYAAPYLGRMNNADINGFEEINTMNKIKEQLQSSTEILVASLRSPEDISKLSALGLTHFTVSTKILEKLFFNKHTNSIIQEFENAITKTGGNII